ncbi:DUF1573 domain-containing protein [Pedobacter sp. Du54]|uniref:DUF1573 domain-containing protein n=1 Tax=Pedobacter anseongensis TaxID=3133439 RepID=UPI0030A840AE
MKTRFIYLAALPLLIACQGKIKNKIPNVSTVDTTKILAGKLAFEKQSIDFGTVSKDTLLVGKFGFQNTGKDPVRIISIQPDCECTNFHISKKLIQPMDTASISLSVSTKNKVGKNELNSTIVANTEAKLYLLKLNFSVKP